MDDRNLPPIDIAFDHRWRHGGIGRFSREVATGLRQQGFNILPVKTNVKLSNPLSPLFLRHAIHRTSAPIFLSPGFMPPYKPRTPSLITIHDLIHRNHGDRRRRAYYDLLMRPLALKCSMILTVSNYSKNSILDWLGPAAPPVRVVGNGVSSHFSKLGDQYQHRKPYILYCGNFRAHKNIPALLTAFSLARLRQSSDLVMVGQPNRSTKRLIDDLDISPSIIFLSNITEPQLAELYRGALFSVLLSVEEGFGLPAIESMASGTPVLCSSTTALGEIGSHAALTVDPLDIHDIANAMDKLATDTVLRQRLIKAGIKRAREFSWDMVIYRITQSILGIMKV